MTIGVFSIPSVFAQDEDVSVCYDSGYNDGRNGEFNRYTWADDCGDVEDNKYYRGFIEGCMSVEGNTRDVCESATDAD